MKKTLLLLVAAAFLFQPAVFAQSGRQSLQQLLDELDATPYKAGGNHYNYPFGEYSVAKAPKGYEPVYISHYGRHGARYITNSAKYDTVAKLLEHGHDKGALTAEGERLYTDYMAIYPLVQHHHGDLTVKGQEQHRELARRIENELEYPGMIKVHVLRETKVVEYAK